MFEMLKLDSALIYRGLMVVLLAAGFAAVGCSEDDDGTPATGGTGESCTKRSDCASGLLCVNQVCQASAQTDGGEETQPLGGVGESCTRRSDCATGLVCIGNVCSESSAAIVSAEGETCGARSDCADGLRCIGNVCMAEGSEATNGARGESCRTTQDCEAPLICVGLTCVEGNNDIERTDNECVPVECETPTDCCPEPYDECETWRMECENGAAGANSVSCGYYDNPIYNCVCDSAAWSCDHYQCVAEVTCGSDLDCTFGVCSDGRCVTCVSDDDCLVEGQRCSDNECVGACETDTQCPVFSACVDGACVDQGCQDNHECIALTGSALAVCQDGECEQPCERDADCYTSTANAFSFSACIDGFCDDIGCKTDQECKIRLNLTGSTTLQARCLPRAAP